MITNMNSIALFYVFSVFLLSVEADNKHKRTLELMKDICTVTWEYDEAKDMFHFTVMMKTTGWAALALTAEKGAEGMKNYDIALGGVKANMSGNGTYLYDYWSEKEARPTHDVKQSLMKESITEMDGMTTLKYSRKADTGDTKEDVKIERGKLIYFAWARGDKDIVSPTDFMKHGDKLAKGRGHTDKGYDLYFSGKALVSSSAILVAITALLHILA